MLSALARFFCRTLPILLWDGIRLTGFVILLSPGFCRKLWFYAVVARRVTFRYGKASCRQTLDVYFPDEQSYQSALDFRHREAHSATSHADNPPFLDNGSLSSSLVVAAPTVIFACGGAWLIGYKMWGALLARALTSRGMIVVLPDYRNYPWGTVPDMVNDMDLVIEWTLDNIVNCGGDASRVVLVGQSAGGHLGLLALWRRSLPEHASTLNEGATAIGSGGATTITWKPKDLGGFLSLSAPFHLSSMEQTFRKHGLDKGIVDRIFGRQRETYDPWSLLQDLSDDEAAFLAETLPPVHLYHGSADQTVPCEGSATFATELQQRVRSDIAWKVYDGWSHTDAILEGPMQGDHRFHNDIVQAVVEWTGFEVPQEDNARRMQREKALCPKVLVKCGKIFMPF